LDNPTDREQSTILHGQEAWRRLGRDHTWEDWRQVGAALLIGRSGAMREAAVNRPAGRRLACANAILDRGFGKPREEQVVEQEDLLTTEYRTVDEIEAALIAKGIPIDRLRAPKLIEHDNDR
jgi:hypothetical protein